MASNTRLNTNATDGDYLVTKEISHDGETAKLQGISGGIVTGTEGAYTWTEFVGGAGAVTGGVLRVTLANNDPAVVDLAAIEVLLTAANVDHAANEVLLTSIDGKDFATQTTLAAILVDTGQIETLLTAIDADTSRIQTVTLGTGVRDATTQRVTVATDDAVPVTGTFWQATQPVSGTVTANLSATDNAVLDVIAGDTTSLNAKQPALGTAAMAASTPVTIASDDTMISAGNASLSNLDINIATIAAGYATETTLATIDSNITTITSQTSDVATQTTLAELNAKVYAGPGLEATAVRVTLPTDGTGQVSISNTVTVDGSGVTQPVSGTVTANLSATDNAVLDSINTNTTGLNGCVGGTELQVDVVASLPAGTNTIGGTISQGSSSTLYDSTTAATIKRASGVAASGTTAIVSAVAGKKFRILALFLKATSATVTNVYLATTTDTDVLGNSGNPIPLAVDADGDNDSGFVMPWNPGGWTETSTANEDLNLILSAAQDVIWAITYIEVA